MKFFFLPSAPSKSHKICTRISLKNLRSSFLPPHSHASHFFLHSPIFDLLQFYCCRLGNFRNSFSSPSRANVMKRSNYLKCLWRITSAVELRMVEVTTHYDKICTWEEEFNEWNIKIIFNKFKVKTGISFIEAIRLCDLGR